MYSSSIYLIFPDCQYERLIGNGICNPEANNEDCQYDGGDCCYADCKVCSDGNCNSDTSKCIGKTEAGGKLFLIYKNNREEVIESRNFSAMISKWLHESKPLFKHEGVRNRKN